MSEEIHVYLVEFGDRRHYQMQYKNPLTGRKETRSTGVERTGRKKQRDAALGEAAKWEAELREGRYKRPNRITWGEFRQRYEDEVVPGLAKRTDAKIASALNWVERVLSPARLVNVTEARLSHLQAKMREAGLSENTIKGNLAHVAAALKWAERMGLIRTAPRVEMPRRAKGAKVMKGRPITGEEFERMLDRIPAGLFGKPKEGDKPLKPDQVEKQQRIVATWRHYLEGLWWSGLRLAESLEVYWDRDDRLCIDLSGQFPMLRIPGELEKGNKDRLLPIAPEFAEFLLRTPEAERTGPVFNPLAIRMFGPRLTPHRVGEMVSDIGREAGVKVNTDSKTGKVKYASAHDLRRSFGERWAPRLMPMDLMALMRHESIETTMRYYVGRNAQNTAKTLWEAHRTAKGNSLANSAPKSPSANENAPS